MIKNTYKVIGVMSGTSLDGIDLAYLSLEFNKVWFFQIHKTETIPYPESWLSKLKNLIAYSIEDLRDIDNAYTQYLGNVILKFIKKEQIEEIDVVCSHGHTALHQPENKMTYQIGNQSSLATIIQQKLICDFRVQDVLLGGQGAPLVPIGDKLLFSEYDFCINLGGFANISFEENKKRIAYDVCPVNIVLNYYTRMVGLEYDDGGKIASTGKLNLDLLNQLNNLSYYEASYPKSLGLEWVKKEIIPIIDSMEMETADILRTFVTHIVFQINQVINNRKQSRLLITGGGAFNTFLMQLLREESDAIIVMPSDEIINFKEALIFGFLGVLKLRNEVNCLQSVTGAKQDHSSGEIYLP